METQLAADDRDCWQPLRDHVLLFANEPLQHSAAQLVRAQRLTPLTCTTPLHAIHYLERLGHRIAHAIVSASAYGALEVRKFLAEEYPQIQRVFVVQ